MDDVLLTANVLDETGTGLAEIATEFAEAFGGPPTLAEFLDILGWGIPINSAAIDSTFIQPLRFKVTMRGNNPYQSDVASRVPELDDHLFEEVRECHRVLVERMSVTSGAPVSPQHFASAILQVLQSGRIILADIKPEDIRKLTADIPRKRAARAKRGDVLAIPCRHGGYHMAVLITRNRFGSALGLFHGTSAEGLLEAGLRQMPRKHPVYTAEAAVIADGSWKIIDNDESLLALFPSEPAIYHRPNAWPNIDTGQFGAAETADGILRLIGPDEAREVGLQDGTYRPTHLALRLQQLLDDKADCASTT